MSFRNYSLLALSGLVLNLSEAVENPQFRLLAIPFPWASEVDVEATYDVVDATQSEDGPDIGYRYLSSAATARLWSDQNSTLLLTVRGGHVAVERSNEVIFQRSGNRLPNELTEAGLHISGRWISSEGWRYVADIGIQSFANDAFDSSDEIDTRVFAGVFIPDSEQRGPKFAGWSLGLLYREPVDFPLPAISYQWQASSRVRASVGIPNIFVQWQIDDDWQFIFNSFAISPNAQLRYRFDDHWTIYGRVGQSGWQASIVERNFDDLRLEYSASRVGLGAEWQHRQGRQLSIEAGWQVSPTLRELDGSELFGDDDREEEIDLDDGLYVALSFQWTFGAATRPAPSAGGGQSSRPANGRP